MTGSWGMDVMVAPERQRRGLGEVLFRTWDRNVGASLGLGLSDASYRLFQKLNWPDVGPVPCLVKPLSRRAFRHPRWPVAINRLVSALTWPLVLIVSRTRPLRAEVRVIQRFDDSFTELWERLEAEVRRRGAPRRRLPELEVRDRAARPLHDRRARARRADGGYAVYRHVHEPRGRVTLLVDFLADPDDEEGVATLLHWIDREARQADSDKIRTFALHAGFRKVLRKSGYFVVKSTMEFVIKVNGADVHAGVLREHRSLARHARRLGSGSMTRAAMCAARGAPRIA